MALNFRRGPHSQFDPSKLTPGEPAAVLSGDPSVPSGKAFYVCYAAGDVKRMVSIEDLNKMVERGDFDGVSVISGIVDDAGHLILTLSNKATLDAGYIIGPKGADGTVTFEDLTDEQKASLKGAAFTFADFTPEQLAGLKGSRGDTGPQGIQGSKGPQGIQGDTGPQGVKGDTGATGPKGDKGDIGAAGPQGVKGNTGAVGPQGDVGPQGTRGLKGDKGEPGKDGVITQLPIGTFSMHINESGHLIMTQNVEEGRG